MTSFSEASAADNGLDLRCDSEMPDMTHSSVVSATVMDHWFV